MHDARVDDLIGRGGKLIRWSVYVAFSHSLSISSEDGTRGSAELEVRDNASSESVFAYICRAKAEIRGRAKPVPTRNINATGQALLKFVIILSPLYLSGYTQMLVHC